MITPEILLTSLVVVLVPGTGVVFTVSTGLVQGRKASGWASLGCTAGIVPHLAATVLGLAAVMHTQCAGAPGAPGRRRASPAVHRLRHLARPDPAVGVAPLAQLLVLSAVFMAMTFAVFVLCGWLAHAVRRRWVDSPRLQAWLRRGFAATFAGPGARLAPSER